MTLILRTVKRETAATTRDGGKLRPLVIELHSGYLTLKPKGCRRGVEVDYHAVYMMGIRQRAEQIRFGRLRARRGAKETQYENAARKGRRR